MRIDREYFIRFAVAVALACYDLPTDRAMTSEEAAQLVKWVIDMALGPDASNVQVEPIFLYGNWSKERDDPFKSRARVYVLKTLKQDKESYLAVGMLVNLICYYANEFVATHLDRFD